MAIAASVVLHAALAGVLSWGALHSLAPREPEALFEPIPSPAPAPSASTVTLPVVGEGILVEEERVDPTGDPPRVTAGEEVPRPDMGSEGRGGDVHANTPALNLADRDDRMRLSPDALSRLDRDQLQRLRVAANRQSWEDRRSTTHPTELTLVVTGTGTILERRARSPVEPSRGAFESPVPGVRGAALGEAQPDAVDGPSHRGGAQLGAVLSSPGEGVFQARPGSDHRQAAPIGSARPEVEQAPVAVAANDPAKPKDNVDSDQEVATTVRSLVHASAAGGLAGEGQGGDGAGGEPGAGGLAGPGSRARPLGAGDGDVFDLWTTDPRLAPYLRALRERLKSLPEDAFPKREALELRQGTVILEFTIQSDGHIVVAWPPTRPSGIDEYDLNCANAIRRAKLPPIPRELGWPSVHIRASLASNNPIIR